MYSEIGLRPLSSTVVYGYADFIYTEVLLKGNEQQDTIVEYFDDLAKLSKPHRETILHDFISLQMDFIIDYGIRKVGGEYAEEIEELLQEAQIGVPKWLSKGKFDGHETQLYKLVRQGIAGVVPSIFYLLYSDRHFLLKFQTHVALAISVLQRDDYPSILKADGQLKRGNIPMWLKRGVFYRDRGRCQLCFKDLTGILSPNDDIHLDHIIPLASSGSNDPTNPPN